MKRLFLIISLISILFITGCLNAKKPSDTTPEKKPPERIISVELNSYDINYWRSNANKQDEISKEIYDLWKKNGEGFGINRIVTPEVTKQLINEYIQQNESNGKEKIFKIACTVIDVECDLYKVE